MKFSEQYIVRKGIRKDEFPWDEIRTDGRELEDRVARLYRSPKAMNGLVPRDVKFLCKSLGCGGKILALGGISDWDTGWVAWRSSACLFEVREQVLPASARIA